MLPKHGSGLIPGAANGVLKDSRACVVPSLNSRRHDRFLIERLGIEQQAIHVENYGTWSAG
jgi:hypothetical protein